MIDYLTGLAERAATPSSTVRPTLLPLYVDRLIGTSDSQFDHSSSIDEFTNMESPASWSETQPTQAEKEGDDLRDDPRIPLGRRHSASRPMQERSQDVDDPSVRDSATEFAHPTELRS